MSTPSLPEATGTALVTQISSILASASTASSMLVTTTGTAPISTATPEARPGAENGECKLLGPFALFIQGALGLLALLSLVYKRWRERPQRPVKIWAFDASKQVVGSGLLHIANLLMSIVSSGELKPKAHDFQANPCSFYLLNLAIDTTIGIPILIIILRVLTHAFLRTPFASPPESIQSGNYDHPPKTKWWLKQCFIYFLGLVGMKLCVFVIFQLCPWIIKVGDWALRWTEGDERVQVFFVMLFFPVVMNAIQYYIIDSFIKDQKPADHEAVAEEEEDEEDQYDSDDESDGGRTGGRSRGRRRDRLSSESIVEADDGAKNNVDVSVKESKDSAALISAKNKKKGQGGLKTTTEYNPETDGASNSSGAGGEPRGA